MYKQGISSLPFELFGISEQLEGRPTFNFQLFLTARAENAEKTLKKTLRSSSLCGSKKPVLQTKGVRNSNLTHSIRAVRNFRTTEGRTNFQSYLTAKAQRTQRKQLKELCALCASAVQKNQYYKLKELEIPTSLIKVAFSEL